MSRRSRRRNQTGLAGIVESGHFRLKPVDEVTRRVVYGPFVHRDGQTRFDPADRTHLDKPSDHARVLSYRSHLERIRRQKRLKQEAAKARKTKPNRPSGLEQLRFLLRRSLCPKVVRKLTKISPNLEATFESFKRALAVWKPAITASLIKRAPTNYHLVVLANMAFEEDRMQVDKSFKSPDRVCGQSNPKIRVPGEDGSYDESRG